MDKTHYRKVFKSDHLGVADLEEMQEEGNKALIFTIKHVRQEYDVKVAGRKGDHNIAYFVEDIKPLVLNATNSKLMRCFNEGSPYVEDWSNTKVRLYIDPNVKMKGEIVGGVRIHPKQPEQMPMLTPKTKQWEKAIDFLRKGNELSKITSKYLLSDKNKKLLLEASK